MHQRYFWHLLVAASFAVAPFAGPSHASDKRPSAIKVSAGGRFLVDSDGRPFFWLGDTAWDLFRALTLEQAQAYLDDRARRGFNIIQASAVFGGYGTADAIQGKNRYGSQPFIGNQIDRPNPHYFRYVDQIVDEALSRGLLVAMHPIWAAWNVNRPDFLTPKRARAYGKWLGRRYKGKNIVWVLGGDLAPVATDDYFHILGKAVLTDYRPIWDAMAEGITEGEGGDPFFTYHPYNNVVDGAPEPRTSLFFEKRPWLDMNLIQSGHESEGDLSYQENGQTGNFISAYNYGIISKEYWSKPVRPVMDFEVRYENSSSCVPQLPQRPCWRDYDVRNAAYQAVFAGAAGHSYGNYSLWDFFDPSRPRYDPARPTKVLQAAQDGRGSVPWPEALVAPGGDDMRHLKALMLSRPYLERIPDQSVIITPEGAGNSHIAATRDRGGSYLMVYIPQRQRVTVDLTKLIGRQATGWWFDPRTGKAERIEEDLPTNDRRTFYPPARGDELDWVLVLDQQARNFAAPGSAQ